MGICGEEIADNIHILQITSWKRYKSGGGKIGYEKGLHYNRYSHLCSLYSSDGGRAETEIDGIMFFIFLELCVCCVVWYNKSHLLLMGPKGTGV